MEINQQIRVKYQYIINSLRITKITLKIKNLVLILLKLPFNQVFSRIKINKKIKKLGLTPIKRRQRLKATKNSKKQKEIKQ